MNLECRKALSLVASSVAAAVLSLSLATGSVPALARADESLGEDATLEVQATDEGGANLEAEEGVADDGLPVAEPLATGEEDPDSLGAKVAHSGTWGECSWSIDSDGLLRIWPNDGSRGMLDGSRGYEDDSNLGFPWYEYREEVKSVSLDSSVILPSDCSCFLYDCDNLEMVDASGWDTSHVTSMDLAFSDCDSLKSVDASGWNTSSVTSMIGLFYACNRLESVDTSSWDTSHVTDMTGMFSMKDPWLETDAPESQLKAIDVSGWDVSSVEYMNNMFSYCCNLETLDVSSWDTSHVESFSNMFSGCSGLTTLDVSGWDTSHAESLKYMFNCCYGLKELDVSGWDTSSVTEISCMFSGFGGERLDVTNWDTSKMETFDFAFSHCEDLTSLDVSGWDISSATSMYGVFEGCAKLESLDVSKWDTSRVTRMGEMFEGCSSLASVDVSQWDISLVENMCELFSGCSSLTSLDLSGWDNSNAGDYEFYGCGHMFDNCSSLARIRVSDKFDTSKAFPEATAENGKWWSTDAGEWFTVEEIQSSRKAVADTYTAEPSTSISITDATITPIADQTYTGKALTPVLTIRVGSTTLQPGIDYDVTYKNNIKVGTATVTIVGRGYYTGTKSVTFKIVKGTAAKTDISEATVEPIGDKGLSFSEIEPEPTVTMGSKTLEKDVDYTLSYEDNIDVGTATVIITGMGDYTGTKRVTFEIIGPVFDWRDVSQTTVSPIADQVFTGGAIEPKLSINRGEYYTLKPGIDFDATFRDNTNVGTATITITGKKVYTGTRSVTFKIIPADIADATVSAVADQAYTGKALTPVPTVKVGSATLKSGTDYTLSYKNNTDAGSATVTITGKGNYTGTKSATFKVTPASISKATVETIPDQTHTGKSIKPIPTVMLGSTTLKSGTDYALSYKDNTNAGTATVIVTGKGNYTGTKSVTFRIVEAPVATQEMYRLYNPNSGEHFYTASTVERDALVNKHKWVYERVGWIAPVESDTPVYRLYNANAGDHHYTTDTKERDALVKRGWKYEAIGWYSDDDKGVPLYRQYNPNAVAGSHNYTTDTKERDTLVGKFGWHDEGVSWYGVK